MPTNPPAAGSPPKRPDKPPVAELDRVETGAYVEVLWSNGQKIRSYAFSNLKRSKCSPAERSSRQRTKRARKVGRRRKGNPLKARLAQHGLTPRTIRFSWQ